LFASPKRGFHSFSRSFFCLANTQDRLLYSLKKNFKKKNAFIFFKSPIFGLTTKIGLLEKNGVVKESNFWCCEFARPKNGFFQREKKTYKFNIL
jgi:hypothetical protein